MQNLTLIPEPLKGQMPETVLERMATIISRGVINMNLIDLISYNNFLKKIFPDGIESNVLIGKLSLELGGRLVLNIHTKQKPAFEIAKWGKWGVDYNVIVIHALGGKGDIVNIKKWSKIEYAHLSINKNGSVYDLQQTGLHHELFFSVDVLTFQNCTTYLEQEDIL
ncbi:hypothetical protein HO175_10480 [Pantoea allii]|nr:hypothetical protein [Pantoea allii]